MNRLFIALDGDDAGQMVGQAVLMDDVQALHDVSKKITAASEAVKNLIVSMGGQVISAGGDEMTAVLSPESESRLEEVRSKFQEVSGFTATLGIGNTLSQAGKALLAGKLSGKNKSEKYSQETESLISQAHQANTEGHADSEQKKLDDHYISAMNDQEEVSDHDTSEDFEDEFPDMSEEGQDPQLGAELEPDTYSEEEFDPSEEMASPEDSEEDFMMSPEDSEGQTEEMSTNPFLDDDSDSLPEEGDEVPFSEEEPISLKDDSAIMDENMEDQNEPDGEMEMADDSSMIEEDLADSDGNEEIMQRIAATLDKFKNNKQILDQMKQSNPEMYASILEMIKNMIDLAKVLDPSAMESEQEPTEDSAPEQDQTTPPQMSTQPEMPQDPKLNG